MWRNSRRVILWLYWLGFLFSSVQGMNYILLRGTGSNCITVDPLPGSELEIKYHLPDLKMKDDLDAHVEEKPITEGMSESEIALLERQREVALKRARIGKDVSIAISQRTSTVFNPDPDPYKVQERPRNQREQPDQREGIINFETSETGGSVQICIHSLFASKHGPYRVGLEVNEKVNTTDEEAVTFNPNVRVLQVEASDTALIHLTAFSKEMIRAENLVRSILASADVVKKEESDFYEQSISMEKGVHFWPMFRFSCIIVAAAMQVRYILQFMKAKHIV